MIQLTQELAMTADEHGYIVGKPRQSADKVVRLDKPTYYPTAAQAVSSACARALRQGVADGTITTLRGVIQEQERLQAEFERLIAPLDSGEARQSAVETHQAAETGKDISQPSDIENAVQPVYIVEWYDHEGNRHERALDSQDAAQREADCLSQQFDHVAILFETEI